MWRKRKLLRKQLERLAEQSKFAVDRELVDLSIAMCEVHKELRKSALAIFSHYLIVGFELIVYALILIQ